MGSKPTICFIDDDRDEIARFEKAIGARFDCVTGTGFDECKQKLKERGVKSNLWVLDLYFPKSGVTNTQEQRAQMVCEYAKLEEQVQQFRAFLERIGQGPKGGLELLSKCQQASRAPVVMLTRKGMLDDAIECIDAGAKRVLKKPMPAEFGGTNDERREQLDEAMRERSQYLIDRFADTIAAASFWYRHRGWVGLAAGLVAGEVISRLVGLVI